MGDNMEIYLTIAESAGMVKLSEQTIRRYVLNRVIPYRKIRKVVRFRLSEIEKWIDGGCVADNYGELLGFAKLEEADDGLFQGTAGCPNLGAGSAEADDSGEREKQAND
jgi:excisionase family DNA binding protein